ncbi:MAG: hypothetical protein JW776_06270 [Candidatus Lokiarchaeota archaeon]|nr:hypothetical protein [Candidatus Lokiarchaeota archaeon]
MSKRLLSIDFIRGLAIFGVVFAHGIVFGIFLGEGNAVEYLPRSPLVIFAPMLYLGTWAGLFALITGIANSYIVYHRKDAGNSIWRSVRPSIINNLLILLFHFVYMGLFVMATPALTGDHQLYSLFTGSIQKRAFSLPEIEIFFKADALSMIASSGLISCFTLLFMWRKDRFEESKNINIRNLTIFAIVWLTISKALWEWLNPLFLSYLEMGRLYYVPAFFLSFIAGSLHCVLPYAGYALIGIVIGIFLAEDRPYKAVKRYCRKLGLIFLIVGLLLVGYHLFTISTDIITYLFRYKNIPPDLSFINLGLMLLWIPWFFRKFDFESGEKTVKRSIFIRRFGMLSLTIYCLEALWNILWSNIFHSRFGELSGEFDAVMGNVIMNISYLMIVVGFWFVALKLWELIKFKYSFEDLSVRIGGVFREHKSDRLNTAKILYNPRNKEHNTVE